jgi:hypothetical protein
VIGEEGYSGKPEGCVLQLKVRPASGGDMKYLLFSDSVKNVREASNRLGGQTIRLDGDYPKLDGGVYDGVEGIYIAHGITPQDVDHKDAWFNRSQPGYFDREGPHITNIDPETPKPVTKK